MPEAVTWIPRKKPWRKPSTRRQRQCSNPLPVSVTWTQGVPEGTGPLGRRRGTPMERISPLTPLLLIHLVRNRHFPLSRLLPLTHRRTTTEALGIAGDEAKTHLRWALTPSQRSKKTSSKLSASTVGRRAILPISILKRRNKSQKTSIGLGNLHVND